METFDVIVIGAGVAGSAAALALADNLGSRGRVLLLEQFPFGHRRGSSHGGSRIFRHAYDEPDYVQLALRADDLWGELETRAGEQLLVRCGGLDIDRAEGGVLDRIENTLRALERPLQRLTPAEVRRRFPAFSLADDEAALYSPAAGVLPASRCVGVMQRLAAEAGVVLRDSEPVLALTPNEAADAVEVASAGGRYQAARVVLSGGAWLAEGPLAQLVAPLPLHIEQQQVIYLRAVTPPLFAHRRFPIFIHHRSGVYGFPLFERPHAIKVSDHTGAPTITLAERREDLDPARAAATAATARSFLPALGGLVDGETCLYTKTPDEHFVLGLHPEQPQLVLGGGFSGHGFKFGPVLGEILAELALEGRSRHPLERFAPTRFARPQAAG